MSDLGWIPGLGRFPGEGNGNPLQYSCLENPMDGGDWCRLLSMGSQRVGHDWATPLSLFFFDALTTCYFLQNSYISWLLLYLFGAVSQSYLQGLSPQKVHWIKFNSPLLGSTFFFSGWQKHRFQNIRVPPKFFGPCHFFLIPSLNTKLMKRLENVDVDNDIKRNKCDVIWIHCFSPLFDWEKQVIQIKATNQET